MGNVVSIAVCHETRTDVGFINVIVMFSGATRMEPSKKRKQKHYNYKFNNSKGRHSCILD